MTEIEKKKLIARLRARTDGRTMLACDPPRPAPDRDCHAAADLIEQHEAFRQEVSEIVEQYVTASTKNAAREWERLKGLIIAKPDPLVEAIKACDLATLDGIEDAVAHDLRAAMNARGYEWTKIVEDK